jgi:DNA transformation protein
MALTAETVAWLEDLFSVVPGCSVRKMFGGAGVFRDGLMFALVEQNDRLAFKADEETVPAFRAEGMGEWTYPHKSGKEMSMGYWYAPDRLFDDPDEFRDWAQAAFAAAMRADAKKPPSQRKLSR